MIINPGFWSSQLQAKNKTHNCPVQSVESSQHGLHDERLQGWVNHQSSTFGDGALAGLIQDLAMAKNLGAARKSWTVRWKGHLHGEITTYQIYVCMQCMECMEICNQKKHIKKNTKTLFNVCVRSHSTGIDSMEIHAMHLEIANRRKPSFPFALSCRRTRKKFCSETPSCQRPKPVIPVIPVMLALQNFISTLLIIIVNIS